MPWALRLSAVLGPAWPKRKEDGMPTPEQMAAGQQSTIPRELLEQMPQQRGSIMGAGHAMAQIDGVMAARLAELSAEVRELRAMLAPPSAVILTGAEVAEHFRRLREGGA